MDAKYLAEIKARLDAGRLPMKSDMEALLAEVERLTAENKEEISRRYQAECNYDHAVKDRDDLQAQIDMYGGDEGITAAIQERDTLKGGIEAFSKINNTLAAENATLKKALTRACEEITKHTCECPASLYGAEMCENCNDDDCDSNRTDRWCDYFIQAQEQEGKK